MKSTILVTGANGQLGSEIKELERQYAHLSFTFTDIDNLDISDPDGLSAFLSSNKFDYIVNCAGYTAVDKAESEPEAAQKINALGVKNLVTSASRYQTRFIHISTDYVFDGKNYKPYSETDIPNPQSMYGISKLKGEEEALKYELSTIIRTSWLYSSFGNNFLKTALNLSKERDELRVVFDQAGTPTFAHDLASVILDIIAMSISNAKNYVPGIYHYSNEGICSWYDFALEIMKLAQLTCRINPIETREYPTPARRPFYSVLNKKKIKDTYHIHIPHWKESLQSCLQKMKLS